MRQDDVLLKLELETILQHDRVAEALIRLFESMPQRKLRRALFLLSTVYPDKRYIEDEEFEFIYYVFTQPKFLEQETIRDFVGAMNIIEFTEKQKIILRKSVADTLSIISKRCTFELDEFLMRISLTHCSKGIHD